MVIDDTYMAQDDLNSILVCQFSKIGDNVKWHDCIII